MKEKMNTYKKSINFFEEYYFFNIFFIKALGEFFKKL